MTSCSSRNARRDFDDLLVTTLHRAIALVQVQHVAVLVAENLHLDVLRARNVFSRNTAGLPNARPASVCASSSSFSRSPALCTTRMPRPPPPKAALMMSGKPISFAAAALRRDPHGSSVPSRSAPDFLRERAGGRLVAHHVEQFHRGPTKMMPASAHALANSAFSLRKP
jgi:hypothetical protein